MNMATVTFEFDGFEFDYIVRFAYDPRLVDLIKTVPRYYRSWNPTLRQWRVSVVYARTLANSMRQLGCTVVGLDQHERERADPPPHSHGRTPRHNTFDLLFERVGHHRAEPVFRALTRVLHPDVGGDTELMKELNNARDRLMKEWAIPGGRRCADCESGWACSPSAEAMR